MEKSATRKKEMIRNKQSATRKVREREKLPGLRDHDRVADLIVAHRSIDQRSAKTSFCDRSMIDW